MTSTGSGALPSLPKPRSLVLLESAPPAHLAALCFWLSRSTFGRVPKHLTNDSPTQRAEQCGCRAAGIGQIHSRHRQEGRRRRTPAPISVPWCPLPHVMTVQHNEAEMTQVHLLPVMAGSCQHACPQAAQPPKHDVGLIPTSPSPRRPPNSSQIQTSFHIKRSVWQQYVKTYLAQ